MAGYYELVKGLLGVSTCLAILSTFFFIENIFRYGAVFIPMIPIFFWVITAYFWRGARIGRRMRGMI